MLREASEEEKLHLAMLREMVVRFCGEQMGDAGDQSGFGRGILLNGKAESKEAKSKMMVKSYERVIVRKSKGKSAFVMVFDFVR